MSRADVLARIDQDELVALTRDLVRIPSVVKPGDPAATEAPVAHHVERWLAREGFAVATQEAAPGRPNVMAWLGAEGPGPALLLEGHTDVVTEGNPAEWHHPPFAAELIHGRIYGRGAADMKGGLAAAMIAAAAVQRAGVKLRGRLVVAALVDEEGDMLGVKRFCAMDLARQLTGAIICEPEQNELCLEQRGVVWARVTLRGRMGHGAMPEAAVNPIVGVWALLGEIPTLERRLRRGSVRSRYLRPPTVTPTVVQAPVSGLPQSNVIPSGAAVTLDVRLTPGPDADAVGKEIDEACQRAMAACPGLTVEWRPLSDFRPATRVEAAEPLVKAMVKGVRQATGRRARFGGVPGSTDGTVLRATLGIPIVTCGPGHRLIPHQVDEYVEVDELLDAARIYASSALNFLET